MQNASILFLKNPPIIHIIRQIKGLRLLAW